MESCVYEGWVRHRRYRPVAHDFTYRIFLPYVDLDELDDVSSLSRLWGNDSRWGLARFRYQDHLHGTNADLAGHLRELVAQASGIQLAGPIRLLAHWSYFGYCFNPVSFFFCFDADRLQAIVAEVHNTPWRQRHCYVLDCRGGQLSNSGGRRFQFDKEFHVSPFMPMEQRYDWRFVGPGEQLVVHMESEEGTQKVFDATMTLRRRELSPGLLNQVLWRYPVMTIQVMGAIYWQAFRLMLKRVPVFDHPDPVHRWELRK